MSAALVKVAIVGHTNTGKTSLLRTLTHDRQFGEVADAAGTTRHVEAALCWLDGEQVLAWYDTPGLEDSMALRDWLESLPTTGQRLDGADRIEQFLRDPRAGQRFEQESRVLQQITQSDAVLYVIDVREPVLPKYRDELYLLNLCARPVLPVLNFIASSGADPQPWIQALARLGLHIHLRFDTVSPPIDGEALVFRTLGQLLSSQAVLLESLAQSALQARQQRRVDGLMLIAGLLVDAAALQDYSDPDATVLAQAVHQQQQCVRMAEQRCVDALLLLFQFGRDDYLSAGLPWSAGRWHVDLFSSQALRDVGVHLGKGAAAGALAGAAVDVMSAGLTLGTGTLIGAAAGTAWQGLGRWGTDLVARIKGQRSIRVSDEVLVVLALRQLQLLEALEHRGHAAQGPLQLEPSATKTTFSQTALIKCLAAARQHEQWSSIKSDYDDSQARQRVVLGVAEWLSDAMQHKTT